MTGTYSYKTWGPSGDLLSCLPGMRQIYRDTGKKAVIMQRLNVETIVYEGAIHAIFDEQGRQVAMSKKQWEMLTPLLLEQPYIERCEVWEGQPFDVNLDLIREGKFTPMPHGDLYFWQQLVHMDMATNFSEPWLDVWVDGFDNMAAVVEGKIIVNLTERYRNQHITYYWLKEYEKDLIFVGTEKEHKVFKESYNISCPRLIVNNFLELARAINGCKFFLGNQSMCYHIAEGLAKKRMLEISLHVPNVWPHTIGGFPYFQQPIVEIVFKKWFDEAHS